MDGSYKRTINGATFTNDNRAENGSTTSSR